MSSPPLHRTLKPLSPAQWGQFSATTSPAPTDIGLPMESIVVPIVGAQHRGITPYPITGPITVQGEPDNPHDDTALAVIHNGTHIGYVPKDRKHWFAAVHPEVWNCGEGISMVNSGGWDITIVLPAVWKAGYYAFNQGWPASKRDDYETAKERNWWLAGWTAAREYSDMLS